MNRNTIYITAALVVVLLAAVISVKLFTGGDAEADPSPMPAIHAPVAETASPALPTPTSAATELPTFPAAPTPSPVSTATPAPVQPVVPSTPKPTVPPTPAPTPTPVQVISSGSFSSDTGTYLNLKVDWKRYNDAAGQSKLQAELSAVSYSLYTDALFQALTLTVDGRVYSANSPAISYGGDGLKITPLATFTVDVPDHAVTVTASWRYDGSYSGVELENIVASGTVS